MEFKPKKVSYTPLEILEMFAQKNLPENFCIVPFTNLIFNPNGDVGVCRQKGTEHVVGNVKEQSVADIWNSEYLQKWRSEFLSGEVKICSKEIHNDACHLGGENYTLFPHIDLNANQKNPLLKLTANFNGQCNLKCTMCDIWMMQNGLYDEIGFWDQAHRDFFPHIKEIELLSGEPFIQKDTYRLIEEVSGVNPSVWWSFTTNAHWRLNKKIESSLDKINIKNIICSIDSLDPTLYSEIRKEGRLSIVLENIAALKAYEEERKKKGLSALNLTLHFLVMKNNWHELPQVVDYVESAGMRLIVNNCYDPKELSLHSLSNKEELEIALDVLDRCEPHHLQRVMRFFMGVAYDLEPVEKAFLLQSIREKQLSHKALD
ncbi:MAG: SPASM domain-containing protein [Bdellovibrionota bacterium]|nr:SPASM domain-containing protein [Bdellovibrionota bacterium]